MPILLFIAAVTGFWFALAWIFRAQRPAHARIGIIGERAAFLERGSRDRPLSADGALSLAGPRPALRRRLTAPVLLIHGVLCNAGVWYGFRKDLAARGLGPLYTISYGPPLASIELFADQVAKKIDAILAQTGAAARRDRRPQHGCGCRPRVRAASRRAKVASMTTFGAPHHGSVHAWLFPGACLAQLRPGNEWLAELNRSEDAPPVVRMVSIWSWHDSMVAPQTSGRLRCAENIELVGVGHNALLADRRVRALVAAELERVAGSAELRARSRAGTASASVT